MKKQPVSHDCFVCGRSNPFGLKMDFYSSEDGEVHAEHTVPAEYQGWPGVVHGGVVAAMLDEVVGRVWWVTKIRTMVTAQLKIRYRKPVPVGEPLRLIGKPGKIRDRFFEASGAIYDKEGNILAEADGLYVEVPEEMLMSQIPGGEKMELVYED